MKKLLSVLLATMLIFALCACAQNVSEPVSDENEAAASDWDYVSEKGKMIVGMTLFSPMNYYEGEEFVGFDTELAKAAAEKLGIEVEFVEINWDSKEIELNSKNIDCIWNGMCITDERKETMSMTEPYLNNSQAIVMKSDRADAIMADVTGLKVVAEQGSTGEGKILGTIPDDATVKVSAPEYFANAEYTAVDSMAKALLEVKSGTADLALVDSVCAFGMVGADTDYADLTVNIDNNFGDQYYGIAFRKGSDITAKVNQIISDLYSDGTVLAIAEKYGLANMLLK